MSWRVAELLRGAASVGQIRAGRDAGSLVATAAVVRKAAAEHGATLGRTNCRRSGSLIDFDTMRGS